MGGMGEGILSDRLRAAPTLHVRVIRTPGADFAAEVTDDDGRHRFADGPAPGVHRLTFATGDWFDAAGRECFYPEVTIAFLVGEDRHYHVPLLLSPFAYSTYRGS